MRLQKVKIHLKGGERMSDKPCISLPQLIGWLFAGYWLLSLSVGYGVSAGEIAWAPEWLMWPWRIFAKLWG